MMRLILPVKKRLLGDEIQQALCYVQILWAYLSTPQAWMPSVVPSTRAGSNVGS